ncbi:hypothetical protein GQ457_02G027350 [Hibiscus cannabinus]
MCSCRKWKSITYKSNEFKKKKSLEEDNEVLEFDQVVELEVLTLTEGVTQNQKQHPICFAIARLHGEFGTHDVDSGENQAIFKGAKIDINHILICVY